MERVLLSLALSGLGRDALKFVAALALAMVLALAFSVSTLMTALGAVAPGHEVAEANTDEIPSDHLVVMRSAAAETCGLPWQVVAAIAKVESNFGQNMATSSAGAIGYGQFLPSSWAAYGNGGDPYDYRDAIPAIARYLCAHGAPGDLRRAVWAYNHLDSYVDMVLTIATRYGLGLPDIEQPEASSALARVVLLARTQIGRPYVWGGASPVTSFDCSGLVQWAYGQLGARLPRTAQQQFDATARVSRSDLKPGDLVFFEHTYPSSERITHVGIYVGNGRMINAPTIGDVVREMDVFNGYWGARFAGGGRVRSS
ncbi:MAG: bifunctional lytic transglycosylase/C40 family peptidase [Chloroflexi bacterium]|nr:bifunctional lytic transglycosylase/C40 family peptidase [Chloroflexota bacterium]